MTAVLVTILAVVVLIAAMLFIPRFFIKRAIRKVIALFRKAGATSPDTATTLQRLGLQPRGFIGGMGRMRDYKPQAIRLLVQADIIQSTEDGAVYLSEKSLERSPVKNWASVGAAADAQMDAQMDVEEDVEEDDTEK